jgi:hypothetical protein
MSHWWFHARGELDGRDVARLIGDVRHTPHLALPLDRDEGAPQRLDAVWFCRFQRGFEILAVGIVQERYPEVGERFKHRAVVALHPVKVGLPERLNPRPPSNVRRRLWPVDKEAVEFLKEEAARLIGRAR